MDLKGTKTEKNLMEAFAGESQARNKYTYFASVAKKEGYVQISKIFEETAIVTDEEALKTAKDLARLEGIMCGISSGTNVAAAIKLAKVLGEGKTVVTVLPDTGERYFSTELFE